MKAWHVFVFFACLLYARATAAQNLETLLSRFQQEHGTDAQKQALRDIADKYPESAGPELVKIASQSDDAETKQLVIAELGTLKFWPAEPFIVGRLHDRDPEVRESSVYAIDELRDFSAIPALIELLRNEQDAQVIQRTALVFYDLGARSAVPVLKLRAYDGPTNTRLVVIGSIWGLGTRDDVPFLATFLDDKDGFVALWAVRIMEEYSGTNFSRCGAKPCTVSQRIRRARGWWQKHSFVPKA